MNLIIAGLGGQGVVFFTRLLAQVALELGYEVVASETHGMSQRGGLVVSHFKIGSIQSPLIAPGKADAIIAFEREEALRYLSFSRDEGSVFFFGDKELRIEVDSYIKKHRIKTFRLNPQNSAITLKKNMLMMGFMLVHLPIFSFESVKEIILKMSSNQKKENLEVFEIGFQLGQAITGDTTYA